MEVPLITYILLKGLTQIGQLVKKLRILRKKYIFSHRANVVLILF